MGDHHRQLRRSLRASLLGLPVGLMLLLVLGGCISGPPENEGSVGAPIELTVGRTHDGEVGAAGTSYYSFVAPGNVTHTIGLTLTESDLGWSLYSSSSFSGLVQDCDTGSSGNEVCQTPILSQGSRYYLEVRELDGVAGRFDLLVRVP